MAGESSIDTGINVGEAQVFRPYNDQGLTGQAEIGIEQDKLNRKATAQKEKEKQLKDSLLEFKGDGIVPALSNVATSSYKDLNKFATESIQQGLYNDYNFNNRINGEKAVFAQFLSDGKEFSKDLSAIQKLSLEGKLDDESQKIFDEMLMNPKHWDEMKAKGASVAEISGAYSAALKSVKEKPAAIDWQKHLKYDDKATLKAGGWEDKETGKTANFNLVDEDKTMSYANKKWSMMSPEEQIQMRHDLKLPDNKSAVKYIYDYLVDKTNTSYTTGFKGDKSGMDVNLGGGAARKGKLILRLTGIDSEVAGIGNDTELTKRLGIDYIPAKDRKSIAFSWDDKDKMNAPVKMNSDETKKTQILGVPVGLEQNENGDWEYILSVKNAGAPEGSKREFRTEKVPYKGNETHTNELEGFKSPDEMYEYTLKMIQENNSLQDDNNNTPKNNSITTPSNVLKFYKK